MMIMLLCMWCLSAFVVLGTLVKSAASHADHVHATNASSSVGRYRNVRSTAGVVGKNPLVRSFRSATTTKRQLQETGSVGYAIAAVRGESENVNTLYRIDLCSGTFNVVGNITGLDSNVVIAGSTYRQCDNMIYLCSEADNQLYTLDVTTAEATFVTDITGLNQGVILGWIASDPSDDCALFYVAEGSGALRSFDASGQAMIAGSVPLTTLGGDFDRNGNLLWLAGGFGGVGELTTTTVPANPPATLVGPTGIFSTGISFDFCNDWLYGVRADPGNPFLLLELYRINTTAAESTLVGDQGMMVESELFFNAFVIMPSPTCPTNPPPCPPPPNPAPTPEPLCYVDSKDYWYSSNVHGDSSSSYLHGGKVYDVGDICAYPQYHDGQADLTSTEVKVCCRVDYDHDDYYKHDNLSSPREDNRYSKETKTRAKCVSCSECSSNQAVNDACCAWAWWDESEYGDHNDKGNDDNHHHHRHLSGIYHGGCYTKLGHDFQCCKCSGHYYTCIHQDDSCEEACKNGGDKEHH